MLRRIASWLDAGGAFVAIVEHPIVTSQLPKTGWMTRGDRNVAWPVDNYFSEGMRSDTWFVDGVVRYHRTVSTLVNGVTAAGLVVDLLDEPRPGQDVLAAHPDYEDELIRPSLLALRALKR